MDTVVVDGRVVIGNGWPTFLTHEERQTMYYDAESRATKILARAGICATGTGR